MILLPLFVLLAVATPLPPCGAPEWFWSNVKQLFLQPLVDHTTLAMDVDSATVPLPVCDEVWNDQATCTTLGVANGLDVIAVFLRISTGWHFPFVAHQYCRFDVCPKLSSVAMRHHLDAEATCRHATATLHCALANWHWVVPWLLLMLLLMGGFISALVLHICGGCGYSNM
jgi:hypothetical protein